MHIPFEHLLCPLQSESEPQWPQLPEEQCPTLQSESEPQAYAEFTGASRRAAAKAMRPTARRFVMARTLTNATAFDSPNHTTKES